MRARRSHRRARERIRSGRIRLTLRGQQIAGDGISDPGAQPRIDDSLPPVPALRSRRLGPLEVPWELSSLIFGALLLNRRRRR